MSPSLQHEVQAQLVAERQRVVQALRLVLLLRHAGHLCVPLRQLVVGRCVGGAQESLQAEATALHETLLGGSVHACALV